MYIFTFMRININLSELENIEREIDDRVKEARIKTGRDAISYARKTGEYRNHTFNLRNANGFCVVEKGEIVALEVDNDGVHSEAKDITRKILMNADKPHDGIYLCNGMYYAGYVEKKDYDVLRQAEEYASERLKEYLLKSI